MTGWVQIGTVEILKQRIYAIDPMHTSAMLCTEVVVEPGTYPVFRKDDAIRWVMEGGLNEVNEKIGDGLYIMHGGDNPTGLNLRFPSRAYGPEEFAELLADPICAPGPGRRLCFDVLI